MRAELFWLNATIILTAVLWMPYIVNRLAEHGIWPALRNPDVDQRPRAAWAHRLMRAHANAVENLVLFAPLVLMVVMLGKADAFTANAAGIFFLMRVAHPVLYTLGVPFFRTVVFFAGFLCQMALAGRIAGVV